MMTIQRYSLVFCAIFATCWTASVVNNKQVIDTSVPQTETTLNDADFHSDLHQRYDLQTLGIKVKDDPTIGNYSEGDILLESPKKFVEENNKLGRNAIKQIYRRWPNNEIPYTLSSQYGSYARSVIANAMNEYHTKTCVKFVARDPSKHHDYLWIHPDEGCYSLVGKTGGKQPVSLDSGCIQVGTIVHELMHAVGFFHEQSRQDRDSYIDVVWQNVMNGADDQFEKYNLNVISHLDEPYDYASIMHYGPYAFSGSGKKTLVPKKSGSERMGQRVKFSDIDVRKINKLYNCPGVSGNNNNNNNNQINSNSIVNHPQTEPCEDLTWRCRFWSLFSYCQRREVRAIICRKSCSVCK
ncbi:Metalloendopeptidase [Caenorhabditis elegans]|uniref:Metalloendopeptidase n=1 Tax=Caenorhabditis elegans TaxID=6239 RepID=D7SFI4_CAEEL|nr:Metalloendopeptidase [Caenorhabditis elegans]CCD63206.1 Metalloendopeptidase [Caenorhabditis elegans]|eukprot:NP_001254937.1 Metalloendopeptidase [Caenorhabditis elegans]